MQSARPWRSAGPPRHGAVPWARTSRSGRWVLLGGASLAVVLGVVRVLGEGHALFPTGLTGWAFAVLIGLIVGHLAALGREQWWGGSGSGAALTLAILLLYGWVPAVLVTLALVTLTGAVRRGHWGQAAVHGACDILGVGAAALVLAAWGTHPSVASPWEPEQWQPDTLPELLLTACAYLLVNRLLLWWCLAPPGALPVLARTALLRQCLVAVALLGIAPLIVVVAVHMPVLLPLFAVPLIALDSMLWIARARAHEQLLDPLTGLPNRQWLLERVRAALEDADRTGARCALILIDLDRFRSVNDTLGHLTGDRLLLQIAERIERALPRQAETARLGGDEFAVLLPEVASVSEAQRTARELSAALGAPLELDGVTLVIEVSAGVAVYPDHTPRHTAAPGGPGAPAAGTAVPPVPAAPAVPGGPTVPRPAQRPQDAAAQGPAEAAPGPPTAVVPAPSAAPSAPSTPSAPSAPVPPPPSRPPPAPPATADRPAGDGAGPAEAEALLRRADVAMYEAKRGRAGVAVYDPARDGNTPDRLGLLGDLRHALETGQVLLHYQPKVRFNGTVAGLEALVRWEHPQRGRVRPDEFIAMAETSGLMPRLTEFVLEAALGQVARWRQAGITVPVAVNVSPRDVYTPGFAGAVAARLARHGVPAGSLQLEITEHVMLEDPQQAADTLAGLTGHGVRMSLDDFGTGYSSLVHLRRLPVSELKIDRSFVARLAEDGQDAEIVRCTVELAHSLGLVVVAEGVEDSETWERLRRLGCDAVQGWLVAPAMPAAETTAWLRARERQYPAASERLQPVDQVPGPAAGTRPNLL